MRVLLQRVTRAAVHIDGRSVGSIDAGYVLFVGVLNGDAETEATWLARKVSQLRLFTGPGGRINDRSILETGGGVLVVSQFTLAGTAEDGNRPDYTAAARPEEAEPLYAFFCSELRRHGIASVETGVFGAMMEVSLVNDGPVTLLLERAPR